MNILTHKQDQLEPDYKNWEVLLKLKYENAFLILKLQLPVFWLWFWRLCNYTKTGVCERSHHLKFY